MNNKSLVVILIVIIGLSVAYYGITGEVPLKKYIFSNRDNNEEQIVEEKSQTELLSEQSSSDVLSDIEVDVLNTDLGDLDRELLDIESELNQL